MRNGQRYWLDDPRNVRRIYVALWIVCLALVAADLTYVKEGHFRPENLLGFLGLYGFVSYVCIVLSAKRLRKILRRDEDYYDR